MSFWTTAMIIAGIMWTGLGLARVISRRELQHQQTISMLNAIYASQTAQRSIMENVQMDLSTICARQVNIVAESNAVGDEAI
jgi:hypothetical protein